ncbi:MAG: hypothetical protein K2L89_02490, partial [Muribaculaceae bacterium]|nr:hypothetical protein [Muribaculaceae bacterium]
MKTTKIIRSLALLLFSSYIVSCSDSMPDRLQTQEEEGDITIVLRLPVSGNEIGTRANPVGGEDGNGREKGLENENAVFDANIFFFKEDSLNPSGDAAAVTVANVYVKDLSKFEKKDEALPFEKKVTLKIKSADTDLAGKRMLEGDAEVSFITVLNAGRDLSKVVNNLRELREYINIGDTWTSDNSRDASKCRRFVMTTAYDAQADGSVVIGGTTRKVGSNRLVANTASDAMIGDEWNGKKWIGETTVQRMCARIDLMYKTQNIWGNELLYTVPVSGNQVHVTNFLPVNIMSKPSYLISKSTAAIPSAWTETGLGKIVWGGVENTDFTSSIPSNYMIEPRTLSKVSMTSVPDEWYGLTATSSVKENITLADNGKYKDYFSAKLPEKETEFDNCDYMTVISYANENIQAPDCYNSNFITGVAFRAIFQPVVWSY